MEEYQKRGYLLENFRLFHMRTDAETAVDFHYHEFCKVLFLIRGGGSYFIDGQRYAVQPGDILLFQNTGGASGLSHVGMYIGGGKLIHAGSIACSPPKDWAYQAIFMASEYTSVMIWAFFAWSPTATRPMPLMRITLGVWPRLATYSSIFCSAWAIFSSAVSASM